MPACSQTGYFKIVYVCCILLTSTFDRLIPSTRVAASLPVSALNASACITRPLTFELIQIPSRHARVYGSNIIAKFE